MRFGNEWLYSNGVIEEDLSRIFSTFKESMFVPNSTILFTGCAGFLGFYFMHVFARYAESLGVETIIGLDNFKLGKPRWIDNLVEEYPNRIEIHDFDIASSSLSTIEAITGVNYVIHAASIASPTYYRRYPLDTIDANVWGLRNLLDFIKDNCPIKGVLFFSSSEIYGDPDQNNIPTREEYLGRVNCIGPRAAYDEAKRFCETLCWVYSEQYDLPITIVRPFNNYGPGMKLNDRRMPADFADCIVNNRPIKIHSDGRATRTFCYITDAISGYFRCLYSGMSDCFNIGTESPEISVYDVAELYRKLGKKVFGHSVDVLFEDSSDQEYLTDNPARRCPDISKARRILGYNPVVSLEEGLTRFLTALKQN